MKYASLFFRRIVLNSNDSLWRLCTLPEIHDTIKERSSEKKSAYKPLWMSNRFLCVGGNVQALTTPVYSQMIIKRTHCNLSANICQKTSWRVLKVLEWRLRKKFSLSIFKQGKSFLSQKWLHIPWKHKVLEFIFDMISKNSSLSFKQNLCKVKVESVATTKSKWERNSRKSYAFSVWKFSRVFLSWRAWSLQFIIVEFFGVFMGFLTQFFVFSRTCVNFLVQKCFNENF